MKYGVAVFALAFVGPAWAQTTADRLQPLPEKVAYCDISPSGEHVIIAQQYPEGQTEAFLDGKSVAKEATIRRVSISPDGKHFACAVENTDKESWHMLIDGKPGPDYVTLDGMDRDPNPGKTWFSANHAAYAAGDAAGDHFVVLDGREERHFRGVSGFTFSVDGDHWTYRAFATDRLDSDSYMLDGKLLDGYPALGAKPFLPADPVPFPTQRACFLGALDTFGARDLKSHILDAAGFTGLKTNHVALSADGKHYACISFRSRAQNDRANGLFVDTLLIIDGKESLVQPDPAALRGGAQGGPVLLNGDGSSMAYVRADPYETSKSRRVYVGTGPGVTIQKIPQPRVVWDGKPGPVYDTIAPLAFSPDGKHLAYAAMLDKNWQAVIDQKPGEKYDMVADNIIFSADGQHFAYAAQKKGQWRMVLDGKELADYAPMYAGLPGDAGDDDHAAPGYHYSFDKDNILTYVGSKEGTIYRVHAMPTK